jgi:hypothetical protein
MDEVVSQKARAGQRQSDGDSGIFFARCSLWRVCLRTPVGLTVSCSGEIRVREPGSEANLSPSYRPSRMSRPDLSARGGGPIYRQLPPPPGRPGRGRRPSSLVHLLHSTYVMIPEPSSQPDGNRPDQRTPRD